MPTAGHDWLPDAAMRGANNVGRGRGADPAARIASPSGKPGSVGAEAPPTVHPAGSPQVPVGAASAATNEARDPTASDTVGAEAPPTVHSAGSQQTTVGAASAATRDADLRSVPSTTF